MVVYLESITSTTNKTTSDGSHSAINFDDKNLVEIIKIYKDVSEIVGQASRLFNGAMVLFEFATRYPNFGTLAKAIPELDSQNSNANVKNHVHAFLSGLVGLNVVDMKQLQLGGLANERVDSIDGLIRLDEIAPLSHHICQFMEWLYYGSEKGNSEHGNVMGYLKTLVGMFVSREWELLLNDGQYSSLIYDHFLRDRIHFLRDRIVTSVGCRKNKIMGMKLNTAGGTGGGRGCCGEDNMNLGLGDGPGSNFNKYFDEKKVEERVKVMLDQLESLKGFYRFPGTGLDMLRDVGYPVD